MADNTRFVVLSTAEIQVMANAIPETTKNKTTTTTTTTTVKNTE